MIIATLWEQHISIYFSYLPAWELFASMHVLQQPLHHAEQQEFVRHVEAGHAELVAEVREWAELADQWFFLVDSDEWEALREKEIPQVLNALDHMQIYRFNQMISYYHGPVSIQERDRMLASVIEPTAGTLTMDGVDAVKNHLWVKEHINMISGGERNLYWRLTARENLRYFGSLYGLRGKRLETRIEELLAAVGLTEAADTPVERYSKGMKQRLQIARGLINDPDYLFLDEPTLGLDIVIAREIRELVAGLAHERGKGVLLTTHYIREAEALCDYTCFWSMVQNAWDMTNQERRGGTLEITFLSPASRLAMCYGRTLGALIQQVWMFGCFCLFVLFYAGAIRFHNWYLLPVMFVLLLVSSTIWGGLVSVVFLFSRDAEIVLNFLETPMMLFSGTRIPVSCFPRWGRALSLIFPLTYCLSLIRLVLGVSEGSGCWQRELLILGLMLLLLFVATVLLLRRAETQNRRTGELQFF